MPTYKKGFKDLDLNFTANPVTGDVATVKDTVSVKRGIQNVLRTGHYERLFQPEFGSAIKELLFEPMTSLTAQRLETEVRSAIDVWEERADVIHIGVVGEEEYHRYKVSVTFRVINEIETQEVEVFLSRER